MKHSKTALFPAMRFRNGQAEAVQECLAEEIPVALEYNGFSHAVVLATPADLQDLAIGFSLTEGIIAHASEIQGCEAIHQPDGIRLAIKIADEPLRRLKGKRRSPAGKTGGGISPAPTLARAIRPPQAVQSTASFTPEQLHTGFFRMEAMQKLRKQTGATHAAAWLDGEGQVTLLREDVGRHNALDKLIGALARQNTPFSTGAVLVSSRASYEMVQKCLLAGIGTLAAVSAPTALAVRMAEKSALTLIGFARENGHTLYTRGGR